MENVEEEQFYVSPIATPMASENMTKKLLKLTRKSIASKHIKRGVKEVVKAIRKGFKGICILAGDVSPVDVISHIPIQCETKGIPYMFVPSRMHLGTAALTKRPTSVVLILKPDTKEEKERYNGIFEKIKAKNPYMLA
mmetsp:Transcript_38316/g.44644  ORF Transcript_38316/g.44644 Transcript_38316/m.44644 type:complete len:138 (+) Transcript_38316:70-483(+)